MPQYGAVHYPNDGAGSPRLQKGSVEVKDNNAKNKFGINDHVPCLRGDPESQTNY